ncbi:hypothetical protein ACFL5Q_06215 [Planctomycetota bacterium]
MAKEKSIVGDLINFRGLVYSPMNENGVIFLFGKVAEDLNMYVEEIKPGFPDCIGRRFTGRGWERVSIEFEHKSQNFQVHKHNHKLCDIIVCWEHNWPDCPIEVIELRDEIKAMPNSTPQPPDKASGTKGTLTLDEYLALKQTVPAMQALYRKLIEEVQAISEEVWIKIGGSVTFYSPERVFAYTGTRKTTAPMQFFTGGKPIQGVAQVDYADRGQKWGKMIMRNEEDLETAIAAAKESYKRIKTAIRNNEPTGQFATLGEDEEEETSEEP